MPRAPIPLSPELISQVGPPAVANSGRLSVPTRQGWIRTNELKEIPSWVQKDPKCQGWESHTPGFPLLGHPFKASCPVSHRASVSGSEMHPGRILSHTPSPLGWEMAPESPSPHTVLWAFSAPRPQGRWGTGWSHLGSEPASFASPSHPPTLRAPCKLTR